MAVLHRFRRARHARDAGVTLVELMVSIVLLAILMSLVTTAIVSMYQTSRKTSSVADVTDANRNVLQRLDRSVRFANGITTPGAGAVSGSWYVEWRTGNLGDPQTCNQWRYASGALQYRTWTEGSSSTTLTSWTTVVTNVSAVSGHSVFELPAAPIGATTDTATPQHQQLAIYFQTTGGIQQTTTRATQVTLTALNTSSALVPSGICSDVSRSS